MSKILKGENVKKGKDRAPLPTMLIHHKLMLVKCCAKDPPLHNFVVKDDGKGKCYACPETEGTWETNGVGKYLTTYAVKISYRTVKTVPEKVRIVV